MKIWNKLNNIEAILVVCISIRINFVSKGVRIVSLSEPFYEDADDIRTAFSKIRRQKDINLKSFSNITKMFKHPNIIKNDLHYLICYFVLNYRIRNYIFIIYQIHSRPLIHRFLAMGHVYMLKICLLSPHFG